MDERLRAARSQSKAWSRVLRHALSQNAICSGVAVLTALLLLAFIKQVLAGGTQIDNLWTTISIIFQTCAFEAIKSITDALLPTDETLVSIVSERALVTRPDERCGPHVRVANNTLAVAL